MPKIDRRTFVTGAAAATLGASCRQDAASAAAPTPASAVDPVISVDKLGAPPWPTQDPFLFCVHHLDQYPAGDERMGPAAPLLGRNLGQDFSGKDGWSMYHGQVVPGFPRHPHRGFETVTFTRRGHVDHSDSLGATARYGEGDAQWMTAGRGIVHAEMFPLVHADKPNPVELFQIWLNLPARSKMVQPYFEMMWKESIPTHVLTDSKGRKTTVTTVAGALNETAAPKPPPDSWAASEQACVAIWSIDMQAGAQFSLPTTQAGVNRALYFFDGGGLTVAATKAAPSQRILLRSDVPVTLTAHKGGAQLLLLQGRPIAEPVARHGPFVMNSRQEIQQAYSDYRSTGFGGWPWPSNDHVHQRTHKRFAVHADGREDKPKGTG